jgi:hypothetical protein
MGQFNKKQKYQINSQAELFAHAELVRVEMESRLSRPLAPLNMEEMRLANGSCTRKFRHVSYREARDEAVRMLLDKGEEVHPYHCLFCGFFHTGHAPTRDRLKQLEAIADTLEVEMSAQD